MISTKKVLLSAIILTQLVGCAGKGGFQGRGFEEFTGECDGSSLTDYALSILSTSLGIGAFTTVTDAFAGNKITAASIGKSFGTGAVLGGAGKLAANMLSPCHAPDSEEMKLLKQLVREQQGDKNSRTTRELTPSMKSLFERLEALERR